MALLTEGFFEGDPVHAAIGMNKQQVPTLVVRLRLASGPDAGQEANYSGAINGDKAKYVYRALTALGWQQSDGFAKAAQVIMQHRKRVPIEVRTSDPARFGGQGAPYSTVFSIGRSVMPDVAPIEAFEFAGIDKMLRDAAAGEEYPADDVPHAAQRSAPPAQTYRQEYRAQPPAQQRQQQAPANRRNDDDIPF